MAQCASLVIVGVLVVLAACAEAQLGSVHCKVGCACSEEYRPVCGNDLATYQNECKLRCRQCDVEGLLILYDGQCIVAPPPPAVIPAPAPAPAPAPVRATYTLPAYYPAPYYPYPVNYVYAKK